MTNARIIIIGCLILVYMWSLWFFGTFPVENVVQEVNTETNAANHCDSFDDPNCDFTKQSNGYSGWQMGCNYTNGSNADWNEKKQQYGDQMYLACANGLDYARIKTNGEYGKEN